MKPPLERSAREVDGVNWSRVNQWALWIGLAAAVAWMAFFHNANSVQLLPFLVLLACPLLHLYGHGGQEHSRPNDSSGDTQPFTPESPAGRNR